jgi:hypothetical protein
MIPMESTTRTEVQEISFDVGIEVNYELEDGELTDVVFVWARYSNFKIYRNRKGRQTIIIVNLNY